MIGSPLLLTEGSAEELRKTLNPHKSRHFCLVVHNRLAAGHKRPYLNH